MWMDFIPSMSVGLMIGGKEVKFPPCTPAGIQEMIVRAGVETSGAEVVVVGDPISSANPSPT
jgi:5,10-methylene-tetrahydrofolate dehydrogenase/methenyl tetrahydrofolate cyclohydrolase